MFNLVTLYIGSFAHTRTHTHTHTHAHAHAHTQFIALLALSLVAGYSYSATVQCQIDTLRSYEITFTSSYPFHQYEEFNTTSLFPDEGGTTQAPVLGGIISTGEIQDSSISQTAQFFVAWGSLTLIYGVAALLVYMCVTANEQLQQVFDFLVYCVSRCEHVITIPTRVAEPGWLYRGTLAPPPNS